MLRKLVSGLEPLQISQYEIQVEAGVCAVAGNSSDYMEFGFVPPAERTIDIRNSGPWGLDRTLAVGWWHMWGIRRSDTGEAAMMLSASDLGGGLILPTGWDQIRKLPAAWRITSLTAGMQKQVLSAWHSPAEFMFQASDPTYDVLFGPTDGSWERKTLEPVVPTNARFAIVDVQAIRDTANGYAWIRTPGLGDGAPRLWVSNTDPEEVARREIAMSSTGEIEVRTSAGVKVSVRVQGFRIQETY